MCRIPEPYEIADAYYARLERQYADMVRHATCRDCEKFREAPKEWCAVPFGLCTDCNEWTEASESVRKMGCESFEPNCNYSNNCEYEEERDWDGWDD